MELLGVELHGHVEAHLRELQRHKRALPAFFQLLARALRGDVLQVLIDAIQGAELTEQVRRALGAYTPHTGDVIRGVPREGFVVRDLLRRHAVLLENLLPAVRLGLRDAAGCTQHLDSSVHELHGVLVAGNYEELYVFRHLARHRGKGVVGLEAFGPDGRYVHSLEDLIHVVELRPELLWHGGALRLVLGEDLQPELRHPAVPYDPETYFFLGVEQLEQHARKAIEGVCRKAAGRAYALRQRVERPVQEGVAVDKINSHYPDYTGGTRRFPPR